MKRLFRLCDLQVSAVFDSQEFIYFFIRFAIKYFIADSLTWSELKINIILMQLSASTVVYFNVVLWLLKDESLLKK